MLKSGRASTVCLVLMAALALSGCKTTGGAAPGLSGILSANELPASVPPVPDSKVLATAKRSLSQGKYGEAARYYERAVQVAPRNGDAWLGLTASYDRLGRFDLSDRAYAQAAGVIGNTAQYHNNLGYSMMLRGNRRMALEHFLKAIDLAPGNPTIRNNLRLLESKA